jgi:hypothetical protein
LLGLASNISNETANYFWYFDGIIPGLNLQWIWYSRKWSQRSLVHYSP